MTQYVVCPFLHVAFHDCRAVVVSLVTKTVPYNAAVKCNNINRCDNEVPSSLSTTLQNSQGKEAQLLTNRVTPPIYVILDFCKSDFM